MTEEEKLKIYKEGFKDGYNEAVKFYITNPYLNTHPDHYKCKVCGRTGISGVVCSVPNCPTIAYSGSIGAAAAVHNKPIKPNEPLINHSLDYSEYDSDVYRRKETGAVGSDYLSKVPVSSNGAAGF